MQSVSSSRRVIRFTNRDAEVEGFYMLLRAKMPIRAVGEDEYLITEQQCNLLTDNNIDYKVERHLWLVKALRFDIYLPIYYNEKDEIGQKILIEKSKLLDTFKEIRKRFRGVSAEENTIIGSWLDDAEIVYDDENTVYHIVCELTVNNLQWLSNYQQVLADRFRQLEIFVYYIHVYRF